MYRYEFPYTARCCCACVCRCLDCSDIAAHHNGHKSAADMYFTDQSNVCCLYHCIGCFDGSY